MNGTPSVSAVTPEDDPAVVEVVRALTTPPATVSPVSGTSRTGSGPADKANKDVSTAPAPTPQGSGISWWSLILIVGIVFLMLIVVVLVSVRSAKARGESVPPIAK